MIQHPTRGAIPFEMYPYQEEMIRAFQQNRFNIILSARQTGKSITAAVYILWFAIFHFDKQILVASNKNKGAMKMIHRIKYAYECLPMWLKPGVLDDGWNKHNISFDNKSIIDSTATSEDSGRGDSISLLFLDEFAFVKPNIQNLFWTSILPTLSTGGSCIMSSTPNGDSNLFAQLWRSAQVEQTIAVEEDTVTFVPMFVPWDAPPGRDEAFKQQQIGLIGEDKWRQEYLCEFLSSDALLVSSLILTLLTSHIRAPIEEKNGIKFFKNMQPGGTYLLAVDPATGTGNDSSVIEVFDFPGLEQVAEYRSNTVSSPQLYTILKYLLRGIEKINGQAYFSVENNGVGEGIISLYEADLDPPMGAEFISEEGKNRLGMTTSPKQKLTTCVTLKQLVEQHKLKIFSKTLLSELKSFVQRKGSYAAQTGSTDDAISACLIIIRMLKDIASYDAKAYETLYTVNEDDYLETKEDFNAGEEDPMPIIT